MPEFAVQVYSAGRTRSATNITLVNVTTGTLLIGGDEGIPHLHMNIINF